MKCLLIFAVILFFPFNLFAADFKLTSRAFKKGELIPAKYTCEAENISPALDWTTVPLEAQSLALIMEDPDATSGNWVHWVIFDLPPTINNLPSALPSLKQLANGEVHGKNDFKELGYKGPCPPKGKHRYYFRLYALDTALRLDSGVTAQELREAMKGHVVAMAELMGRYEKAKG